jgi:Mrp family chromosome partitioning ATPase
MSPEQAAATRLYDTIAARIHATAGGPRTLGFTAADSAEGTTTVTLGVALALTTLQADPVLLVDANRISPRLSEYPPAGVVSAPLEDCLRGTAHLADAVVSSSTPSLFFLPTRASAGDPPLGALPGLLAQAKSRFRYVLVDLPPVPAAPAAVMSWSAILAQIFIVVQPRVTRRRMLQRAFETLAPVTRPALIVNGAEGSDWGAGAFASLSA